jgi:hypothetical protein
MSYIKIRIGIVESQEFTPQFPEIRYNSVCVVFLVDRIAVTLPLQSFDYHSDFAISPGWVNILFSVVEWGSFEVATNRQYAPGN